MQIHKKNTPCSNQGKKTNSFTGLYTPKFNIIKSTKGMRIEMAVPGYTKEAFVLETISDRLCIHIKDTFGSDETVYKKEFYVSKDINTSNIKARYALGVLHIDLPFSEKRKHTISIN